jgi:hypothetical protein
MPSRIIFDNNHDVHVREDVARIEQLMRTAPVGTATIVVLTKYETGGGPKVSVNLTAIRMIEDA